MRLKDAGTREKQFAKLIVDRIPGTSYQDLLDHGVYEPVLDEVHFTVKSFCHKFPVTISPIELRHSVTFAPLEILQCDGSGNRLEVEPVQFAVYEEKVVSSVPAVQLQIEDQAFFLNRQQTEDLVEYLKKWLDKF